MTDYIDESKVKSVFNKIRKLTNYRDKTDDEVMQAATAIVLKEVQATDVISKFKDGKEKKIAKALLGKYLDDYEIQTVSDRNTLTEVIYYEVVQARLQDRLNKFYSEDAKAVPINILEILHKNSDIILKLKNSLGLNKTKQKRESYEVLDHLQKRYKKWCSENQASRTLKCPHCMQFIMLRMRTKSWEAQGHPFFQDNMLYNKALFDNLDKQIVCDKHFIARVLECSADYIGWVLKKIRKPRQESQEDEKDTKDTEKALPSEAKEQDGGNEGSDALLERETPGSSLPDSEGLSK